MQNKLISKPMKVILSNGSYKFHLAPLASELAKSGLLAAFITAGYPKGIMLQLLKYIPNEGVKRLINRREDIPDASVKAINTSEFFFKFGDFFLRKHSIRLQQKSHIVGFHFYANQAKKILSTIDFNIYHYRNCFGLESAAWAKDKGKITICDHSIGHPFAISYLLNHSNGYLPDTIGKQPLSLLENYYLQDFKYADYILVNSDFVKQTFISCGYDPGKVKVVYWGVDNQFIEASNHALRLIQSRKNPYNILFCGQFGLRKGALQIMQALESLDSEEWNLTIAGGIEYELLPEWNRFQKRYEKRVNNLGVLSRDELAQVMGQYQVFLFPSLMEGSARVVFEALASGCFVITTPNSGSIVKDGIHGLLIEPGSSQSIANALLSVWNKQFDMNTIQQSNMSTVRSQFLQSQYASNVLEVYNSLL